MHNCYEYTVERTKITLLLATEIISSLVQLLPMIILFTYVQQ